MKTLLTSAVFVVAAGAAHAASLSIDFETGYSNDVTVLSNGDEIAPGVTVTSTETIQVVKTGSPTDAFVPNDMPAVGDFGDYFLTGDFNKDTDLSLHFATDVTGLSFDIADIDGSGETVSNSTEFFEFTAYLNGIQVDQILVDATEVNGDAQVVTIAFADDLVLDMLGIVGYTKGGTRNIGWGIDNIHASPVPLPAAGLLLLGGLGGLAAMKRRRKAA
ncbi:VPLPA-CTERM sorting domain-containing protein [Kangsaoukella pontilimi]|uniref:VPLPA-CTERM sorting domain-containing protein n=1 Tax=Kangsaoukella pontilimi TaxID=2691042 RepID=UPI001D0AD7E6|nr:VPLPA-CTERM sorting domain-containing protein [Kangsaoukella pontilimi]